MSERTVRPDGDKIRAAMLQREWGEPDLARKLAKSVNLKTLRKMLAGQEVFRSKLQEVANALRVPIEELLHVPSRRPPAPGLDGMIPPSRLYDPARPAHPGIFVGRREEREECVKGLRANKSYSVFGPPRIGKTSFLHVVLHDLLHEDGAGTRSTPLPAYLDCEKSHRHALGEFLGAALLALIEAMARQHKAVCPEEVRRACSHHAQKGDFGSGLGTLLAWADDVGDRSFQPILLLDRLHHLQPACRLDLAGALRTEIEYERIAVVLSTPAGIEQLFREEHCDKESPLEFVLQRSYQLRNFTADETRELIGKADGRYRVDPDLAELAHELTDGHPYKLHYLLSNGLDGSAHLRSEIVKRLSEEPATQKQFSRLQLS